MSHTDTCTRSLLDFFPLHLTIAQELECRVLCRMFSLVTYVIHSVSSVWGFPGGSVVKNPPTSVGGTTDVGAICGSGRSLEEGNGNPLQCSCLGNPMDTEVWWATVGGVTKDLVSRQQQQLIMYMCQSQSPNSFHPTFPPWYLCICSLCLCLYFCFANRIIYTFFLDSHMCINIQYLCFSF